jgi:hypothetical protein
MCSNCGAVAAIGASEYERHRGLMCPFLQISADGHGSPPRPVLPKAELWGSASARLKTQITATSVLSHSTRSRFEQ